MQSLNLRRRAIPLLLAASGWLVLGVTAVGANEVIRSFAVFAFVLICPGAALVRLLPIRDLLERAVLAVALGMSLAVLYAEAAAIRSKAVEYAGPGGLRSTLVLVVLATICSTAALTELTRG
jgi:hypothetical protein